MEYCRTVVYKYILLYLEYILSFGYPSILDYSVSICSPIQKMLEIFVKMRFILESLIIEYRSATICQDHNMIMT